jgi:hypothetical protein
MQIIRKITTKAVAGKIDFSEIYEKKHIDLMRVYGVARKALPQQTDLGAFIKFSGSFRAESCISGEAFQSGALILPGVAQDLLAGALDGENVDEVQFGFVVSCDYDAESVTKYHYSVESLMQPAEDDPLERLGKILKIGNGAAAQMIEQSADALVEAVEGDVIVTPQPPHTRKGAEDYKEAKEGDVIPTPHPTPARKGAKNAHV